MTRSKWKPLYTHVNLFNKIIKLNDENENITPDKIKPITIWKKNSTIVEPFIGFSFNIYNGRTFLPVKITSNMVGHKFGEFIITRRPCVYKKKSKLKKKK